jgi:chitin disaccharide deacetylase
VTRTLVIVNADDFGCAAGVNRGIAEAHQHGIVTSASLMVNRPAAQKAAAYALNHPEFDVGLHVELRRWRAPARLVQSLAARALETQLDRFRRLLGRDPTHLDSHLNVHRAEPLRPLFASLAAELGVPLRHFSHGVRFCGEFYGHDGRGRPDESAIQVEALVELLGSLGPGVTELGTHPGYTDGLGEWYRTERVQEVRALCDPRVREAIEQLGIELTTFRDHSELG